MVYKIDPKTIRESLNSMKSTEMGIEKCETHDNSVFVVTDRNNFTRLFELPEKVSGEYCFAGGHLVEFKLIDWFYPISSDSFDKELILKGQALIDSRNKVRDFIKSKEYYDPKVKYLMITNYGDTYII